MPAVLTIAGSPVAAATTPVYAAQLVDATQTPVPGSALDTLTLSIVDTLTGTVINSCNQVNILNTGRGSIDDLGNLLITLEVGDTSLPETPTPNRISRSLIIDWSVNSGATVGRHEAQFIVVNLSGP